MGLAISRTIIEGHNGRIWLQPGRTEGAVFHVELPLYDSVHDEDEVDELPNSESVPTGDDHAVVQGA